MEDSKQTKVLIVATDVMPLAGVPTSGTALRTFGFKSGFEALGCETRVCIPKMAFETTWSKASPEIRQALSYYEKYCFDHSNIDQLIFDYEPDLIYCGHWPAASFKKYPSCPVIIDLAGPHLLERFYQGSGDHAGAVMAKLNALAGADYFIVSGPRQAEYFKSFLLRAGLDRLDERIILAPMALSPQVPKRDFDADKSAAKETSFLFAGIFLPWQDPSIGLKALVNQINNKNSGSLRLIGGVHPTYPVPTGIYEPLFKSIENNSRVSRSDLVDIEKLNQEMLEADVAIDLMRHNSERELAVTIRTTTYLWSGLPVIYNNYSDLSDLIEKYNAGWTVDPDDEQAVKDLISSILNNPDEIQLRSKNASRLARNEFSWDLHAKEILSRVSIADLTRRVCAMCIERQERSTYKFGAGREYSQVFLSRYPGLSSIELRFASHSSPTHSLNSEVEITITEDDTDKTVATGKIALDDVRAKYWQGIEFSPLPDSNSKRYRIQVSSTNSQLGLWTGRSTEETLAFPLTLKDPLISKDKTFYGETLCLRVICRQPIPHLLSR